jgi:hypothetical protein
MKVFVYYNLHRKVWSIKALEGENKGRVVAHRRDVVLERPTPKVSDAGRQRVLRERRKNVHAGLVGEWTDRNLLMAEGDEITYNPYKYTSFVYKDDEQPFVGASLALMIDRRVVVL